MLDDFAMQVAIELLKGFSREELTQENINSLTETAYDIARQMMIEREKHLKQDNYIPVEYNRNGRPAWDSWSFRYRPFTFTGI